MTINFDDWKQEALDRGVSACPVPNEDPELPGTSQALGPAAAQYFWMYVLKQGLGREMDAGELSDYTAARDALWPDMSSEEQQVMIDNFEGEEPA